MLATVQHDLHRDDLRQQLRIRERRWLDLLAPADARARLARSALRGDLLAAMAARGPRDRLGVTAAIRAVWLAARPDVRGRDDALYAERLARAAARLAALERATGATAAAWDAVLTVAELRPSRLAGEDLEALLARAAEALADPGRRASLERTLRPWAGRRGPGTWLERHGVRGADGVLGAFWTHVEESLLWIEPPGPREAVAQVALSNLTRWDEVLTEIHGRLAARPGFGRQALADAAQATVERLLEPRVMAAYLTLPVDELVRVAATTGRNLHLATLTGPRAVQHRSEVVDVADPAPAADAQIGEAERWTAFFGALSAALAAGRLDAQQVVFLWLSAGIGAGEAWRAAGLDLASVGSANYHRTRVLKVLEGMAGEGASPARLANPGTPDAHTREVLALVNVRAPDPYVERAADLPSDARDAAPPVTDAELVALLYLFNLGPSRYRALLPADWPHASPGELVARCLAHQDWDRRRRAVAQRLLASARPGGEHDLEAAFLLACMVDGLPSEAKRWLTAEGDQPGLLAEWIASGDAGHEVLRDLRALGGLPSLPEKLEPRPVEREAQLRLYLRRLVESGGGSEHRG